MRQRRLKNLKPITVIVAPKATPIATRPTSPIQRLSNAYFKKNAVAKRISTTAAQPIQRRPIIDSTSMALKDGRSTLGDSSFGASGRGVTGRGSTGIAG